MKYIAYYRVSTKEQNLGIDSQKTIVRNSLKADDTVLATYEEKETGTNKKRRPELEKAIEHCKESGATLLIAKLDRLARNVLFIATLIESGVEFKALDLPDANNLTIHIFSALAEHEAKLISTRTKDALREIKTRIAQDGSHTSEAGNKITSLGNLDNLTREGRLKGAKAMSEKAEQNPNNKAAKGALELMEGKDWTLRQKADYLNKKGYRTSRGKLFTSMQVSRLLRCILFV